jgi:hypothetical protein
MPGPLIEVYTEILRVVQSQPRPNITHADLAVDEIEAWRAGNTSLATFKRELRHFLETTYQCIALDEYVEKGKKLPDGC